MPTYYKKQVEIAREFGISEGTVTNWIKGAINGKNNIQLHKVNDDHYIIKNEHNRVVMLNLAQNGRKFRSEESEVDLVVKDELYDIMSENQVISLINSLKIRKTIPNKYDYFEDGADLWKRFYEETVSNTSYMITDADNYLLSTLYTYLEGFFQDSTKVNVFDVGPGTSEPSIALLKKLYSTKKISKYVAVDISPRIIEISRETLKKTIPDLEYTFSINDIENESLQSVIYQHNVYSGSKKTKNLILFLGATIGMFENQIKILQNIQDGMSPDDLLIISNSVDTVKNRTAFPAFELEVGDMQVRYIASLMNLTDDLFDKEFRYNQETSMREYNLVLNKNVNISFPRFNIIIELKKGERINVWKHKRDTFEFISEKIKQSGMKLQFVAKHPTDPQVIYMSKLV